MQFRKSLKHIQKNLDFFSWIIHSVRRNFTRLSVRITSKKFVIVLRWIKLWQASFFSVSAVVLFEHCLHNTSSQKYIVRDTENKLNTITLLNPPPSPRAHSFTVTSVFILYFTIYREKPINCFYSRGEIINEFHKSYLTKVGFFFFKAWNSF